MGTGVAATPRQDEVGRLKLPKEEEEEGWRQPSPGSRRRRVGCGLLGGMDPPHPPANRGSLGVGGRMERVAGASQQWKEEQGRRRRH